MCDAKLPLCPERATADWDPRPTPPRRSGGVGNCYRFRGGSRPAHSSFRPEASLPARHPHDR